MNPRRWVALLSAAGILGAAPADGLPPDVTWKPALRLRSPDIPRPVLTNPVDSFLTGYFRQHKFDPPSSVTDAVFARRAWFDLAGVVPSPERLKSFEQDERPHKRERL